MNASENKQLALRWLEYAKNDLQAAIVILSREDIAPRTACFLSQQNYKGYIKVL